MLKLIDQVNKNIETVLGFWRAPFQDVVIVWNNIKIKSGYCRIHTEVIIWESQLY